MSCEGGLTLFLELAEVRQQRCPLIRRDEPAIDNQAVRRKKRRQVGQWNQLRQVREEGVVVIEHLLERRRRVVLKIGGGLTDAAQLRDVHPFEQRNQWTSVLTSSLSVVPVPVRSPASCEGHYFPSKKLSTALL